MKISSFVPPSFFFFFLSLWKRVQEDKHIRPLVSFSYFFAVEAFKTSAH